MIEQTVLKEIQNHKHISTKQAEWYTNLLHKLSLQHRSVDDLFFPIRMYADRIHKKRSTCKTCYETLYKAYYQK